MKVPFIHLCGGVGYHLQIIVDNYISMQEGVISHGLVTTSSFLNNSFASNEL